MKFILLCFLLTTIISGAAEKWHTFTDQLGRTFEGEIVSVNQQARIVRVNMKNSNRRITLEFDVLSEADLDYLSSWEATETTEPVTDAPEVDPSSRLYPLTKDEIRAGIREIESRVAPKDIDREQQKTVNQLNIYRFLSGVPSEVVADPKLVANATAAAEACKEHGGLSHDLGHFTGDCNLSSSGSFFASVGQYMDDGGANNRERRGHRRWCLNPPMGKTGFGSGGGAYSAMWAMDSSAGTRLKKAWSYPGRGFYPKEYLHGNAWSLYLTEPAPAADRLTVEVYKLSRRPDKKFNSNEEIPGRKLPVEYVSSYDNTINFEPESSPITGNGIYWVRVKGGGVSEGYVVELY